MRATILMGIVFLLGGCSTAGPFVTSIADAGNGTLTIEKCEVVFDRFIGIVRTGECKNHRIKVSPSQHYHPDKAARR